MSVDAGELLARLDDRSRRRVELCGQIAAERGESAYLVGGCVRDLILGAPGRDLDVVVEGDGPAVARTLARRIDGRTTRHRAFQTARVDAPDGEHIDVATARSEEYPCPGSLPRVQPGTLEDDLRRRDFTINTLAISLDPGSPPRLIDPFGGLEDIESGTVRILHDASFVDDPTRILRALRFSLRLDDRIEEETDRLLEEAVAEGRLDTVSGDRLRNEIELLFEESPVEGPLRLEERGVLQEVQPDLACDRRRLQALQDALDRYRDEVGGREAEERSLVLAACAVSLERGARNRIVRKLGLSRRQRRPLLEAGEPWRRAVERLGKARGGEGEEARGLAASRIDRILGDLDEGALLVGLAEARAAGSDWLANAVEEHLAVHRRTRTALDGADLIELGLPEGPEIGEVLARLRAARLDGEVEDEAGERELAVREIRRRSGAG